MIIIFLLGLFINTPAISAQPHSQSNPPIILTDNLGRYPLGLHLDLLEDLTGQLTIKPAIPARRRLF